MVEYEQVYRGYVLGKYLADVFGNVGHGLNTVPSNPARFGTTSISVSDTLVSSIRPQYGYATIR